MDNSQSISMAIPYDKASMDKIQVQITKMLETARSAFKSGKTLEISFRLKQLKSLLRMYEENNDEILEALRKDMRKSALEGYLYELDLAKNEVRNCIKNVKKWSAPKWIKRNLLMINDMACTERVPYGVALVFGPFNYPFQLTLVPMTGAIAAGNCVIIKPSELAVHSSKKMAELIPKYLDKECYHVFEGDAQKSEMLLKNQFDYIFYTGSITVGRKIHAAANRFLTPCTLELGGKSPVYIDDSVNFTMAAQRIMWGKCMNMGQTCIAPDYVLCTQDVEDKLVAEIKKAMFQWYGTDWQGQPDLARLINKRHFQRQVNFLHSGKVVLGGNYDEKDLWVEPTVLVDVKESDSIMQDEVFGPTLPILRCNSPEQAMEFINKRSRPLCLYIFSEREQVVRKLMNGIRSGSVAVNDTVVQFAVDELPFGGIGESGMGNYHGHHSFKTFTHKKSIVIRDYSFIGDQVGIFRYPPYNKTKIQFLSFLLCHWKKFKIIYFDYIPHFVCFLIGMLFVYFFI